MSHIQHKTRHQMMEDHLRMVNNLDSLLQSGVTNDRSHLLLHSVGCTRLIPCLAHPTGILERSTIFVNFLGGCRLPTSPQTITQVANLHWIGRQPMKLMDRHRGRAAMDKQLKVTLRTQTITRQTAIALGQLFPSQSTSEWTLSNDLSQKAFHHSMYSPKTSQRFSLSQPPSISVSWVAGQERKCSSGWSPVVSMANYPAGHFPAQNITA
jgi:hypothetical protein